MAVAWISMLHNLAAPSITTAEMLHTLWDHQLCVGWYTPCISFPGRRFHVHTPRNVCDVAWPTLPRRSRKRQRVASNCDGSATVCVRRYAWKVQGCNAACHQQTAGGWLLLAAAQATTMGFASSRIVMATVEFLRLQERTCYAAQDLWGCSRKGHAFERSSLCKGTSLPTPSDQVAARDSSRQQLQHRSRTPS